jgi:filamentous hemagglutinin
MTIGSEANLRTPVSSIGLDNYGTLTISGGTISAALGNDTGGTLIASGTGNSITGTFQNNGTMQIQGSSSLLVKSGFGNGSLILLQGTGASLTGGTLSNAGTIQGVGQVGCVVTNTGSIQGQGGELDLAGSGDTNTGTILAPTGGTVAFTKGLATNAGNISVSGGTFSNETFALTNTGIIMGTGSIITGGLTNSAGAQVNLTGGANVFGPVTNAGAMHLYGSPITFYGNVTSTGTVKVTAGAAYFLGSNGASIGGTYNSDPSDNYFQGLTITPTGLVTGGTGDRFFIVGGATLNNAGTFNDPGTLSAVSVANSGTFIQTGTLVETGPFSNSGVATIGGTQNWSAGTTFTNTGTATFQTDSGSATASPLAVAANAGTVTFTSTQHLASLALAPGARAVVTSGVHRSVIVATSFTDAGTVDLSTGDLDLPGASLQAITALAASGYDLTAGGNWSGPGITSTSAATDTTRLTAIGVIRNNQSGTAIYAAANPFDGVTPGTGDVLVKYTYYGDANLDGKVDGSDYSLTDAGYASHGALTGWFNGDFNYDGTIDGSDYALIDNAFNNQGSAVTSAALVATATAQVAVTTAAVPEPACVSVLTFTLAAFTRRRR